MCTDIQLMADNRVEVFAQLAASLLFMLMLEMSYFSVSEQSNNSQHSNLVLKRLYDSSSRPF